MQRLSARAGTLALVAIAALVASRPAMGELEIRWLDGVLGISGDASSAGHAAVMRDVAAAAYPEAEKRFDFVITATVPPGWSLVSEQALRVVATMQSGTATLDTETVLLSGIYTDSPAWREATTRLSELLLPGMRLQDKSVLVEDGTSLAELCDAQFMAALVDREVNFHLGSSTLRPSAHPLLDAIVEITADCPSSRIEVTGHTDASGDEALNRVLSRQRAEAVVSYMEKRGINIMRLSARGAGSSQPIDTSETRAARARNRRIEFTIRFDD